MLTIAAILLAVTMLSPTWGAATVGVAAAVDVAEVVFLLRRTRRRRSTVGADALVGRTALVARRLAPDGSVRIDGELWAASCAAPQPVDPGETVEVLRVDGLVLVVRPVPLA